MHVVLGSISIWTLYALVSCVSVSCLSMAKKVRWELVYDPMPNDESFERFSAADHHATVNVIQQQDDQQRQRDEQQQQQQLWRHRDEQQQQQLWRHRDEQQKRHHHRQLQQQKRDEWQQRRSNSGDSRYVDSVSVAASEVCNCTQRTTIHRLTQNHYPKELLSVTCSGNWCKTASYLVPVLLKSNTQPVENQEDLPDELQQNVNHWKFDPVSIPVACYCSIK
ncbi:UPF0746 protein DDB_G0281095-like [Rhopalosiphum maidis]|uniref:UPF0746 protein DDB_G0281095-like n=1 Tax=Rhopalosiphum maidis TaxID=43146 RepID=UPI000EFE830D|nr:UPF0746 protein DDB_G0281095-like [Rhopalosiphum maidis]